ncbi:MAG: paraquat-inducible protein A [Steroidobacteraceae bacterium]
MRRAERIERARAPEAAAHELIACPDCGLWQRCAGVPAGYHAECHRCRKVLARPTSHGLDASLALVASALLLWIPACIEPFLRVSADGAIRYSALTSGVTGLWAAGYPALAVVVAAFSIVIPWAYLVLLTCVLAGMRARRARTPAPDEGPSPLGILYRWALALRPWAMIEVYLLGACVAYSRIEKVAVASVGIAGWCLMGAAMLMFLADVALDDAGIWHALPFHRSKVQAARSAASSRGGLFPTCTICGLAAPAARPGDRCPRCHARLAIRKPKSIERTWALVLGGFFLFIPANLLPVLTIEQFGRSQPSTILGGVIELVHYGLWPLAAIVFAASIFIPLAKLCGLSWNLFLTQRGSARYLVGRTRLHRAIEHVGRWSNIDVFMVSILVALVQFGELTRVRVQNGLVAFAAVVIVTMIASKCFDSRLMWDSAGERA